MAKPRRDEHGRRIPGEDEARRVSTDTPPGFRRLEGAESLGELPPRAAVTEPGLAAVRGPEDGEAPPPGGRRPASQGAAPGRSPAGPGSSAGRRLSPLLWTLLGAGLGVLLTTVAQAAVCGLCSPAGSGGRGASGVAGVLARGLAGAPVPCPPLSTGSATSLDPSRQAELSARVEAARGRRIEPGTAEAREVAGALLLLGDDAVSTIRPVTGVESVSELSRTVAEPVEGYRRAAELYGRVARYEPRLMQCSLLRMGAAAERLADTFAETSSDPSVPATGATDFPATLESLAETYRRVALQQYEMVLQVPDHDPECTARGEEAFARLRGECGRGSRER